MFALYGTISEAVSKGDIETLSSISATQQGIDDCFAISFNGTLYHHAVISSVTLSESTAVKTINELVRLDNKKRINKVDRRGQTPIYLAVMYGLADVVTALINHRCRLDILPRKMVLDRRLGEGGSLLHEAVALAAERPHHIRQPKQCYSNVITTLVQTANLNMDAVAYYGGTPLHMAVTNNDTVTTDLLLTLGCKSLDVKNVLGQAPIHKAEDMDMVITLFKWGCPFDVKDNAGKTAYQRAFDKKPTSDIAVTFGIIGKALGFIDPNFSGVVNEKNTEYFQNVVCGMRYEVFFSRSLCNQLLRLCES
jgi:ankyrin repeat protein